MRASVRERRTPSTAVGSGRRSSSSAGWRAAGIWSRASGWGTMAGGCCACSRRPTPSMKRASCGRRCSSSPMRRASPHSRRFRWPCRSSQRRCARSPSDCSSESTSSQPWRCTSQLSRNSLRMRAMAWSRGSSVARSIRLSRCHSRLCITWRVSGALPCVSGSSSSSISSGRSACVAAASPKSSAASGKAPAMSASIQRAMWGRRLLAWPLLHTTAERQSSRGRASRWW